MTANRIAMAIGKLQNHPKLGELADEMAITFQEHYGYQNAQAKAHAMGSLTLEEAQIIYTALGEGYTESNGGWAHGVDLATKVVVTRVMGELILR